VQASARQLPFRDGTFAAALAVLTVHHWPERAQSLTELARVAHDRVVVVTWDPSSVAFWLTDEYFPEIVAIDRRIFPTMEELRQTLGRVEVQRCRFPTTARTDFSERTGAGPGRISTRAFGAPSRRSRSFETASLAWSVCGRTSRTAPGSDATGTS